MKKVFITIVSIFALPISVFSDQTNVTSSSIKENFEFQSTDQSINWSEEGSYEQKNTNSEEDNDIIFDYKQDRVTSVPKNLSFSEKSQEIQPFASPRKGSKSTINYKPKKISEDPWAGGTINIEIKEDINIDDVMYVDNENKNIIDELLKSLNIFNIKEIFDKHVNKFYISSEIDLPEGIQATDFIKGVGNDAHLKVDGIDFTIEEDSWLEVPDNPHKILLKVAKHDTVGFWTKIKEQLGRVGILKNIVKSIVRTITAWLLGDVVYVSMELMLPINVDRLSANGTSIDTTENKILTKGKLPPELDKALDFSIGIHGLDNKLLVTENLSIPTWNSYISPWNKKYAESNLTGKSDDIFLDNTTEVTGENRTLMGNNPRNRTMVLPYSDQQFKKESFSRVVNIFTKKIDASYTIKEEIGRTNPNVVNTGKQASNRYETNRTLKHAALSPAQITVFQTVTLGIEKEDLDQFNVFSNETFSLTGNVEASDSKELFADVTSTYKVKNGILSGIVDKSHNYELMSNSIDMSKGKTPFSLDLNKGTPLRFVGEYFSFLDPEETKDKRNRTIIVTITDIEHGLTVSEKYEVVVVSSEKDDVRQVSLKKPKNHLSFGTVDVFDGQPIYNREEQFKLVVEDTLKEMQPWQISAHLDKETLETKDGDQFPGYLIFKEKYLGKEDVLIYKNNKKNGQTFVPINWQKNEGILLKPADDLSKADHVTDKKYDGTVTFTLTNEPELGAQ